MATATVTTPATEQPLYIQYCGSWCVHPQGVAGHAILTKLPAISDDKAAKIARSGKLFAAFLRDNKIGKLVSNLNNLLPELRAIALNY